MDKATVRPVFRMPLPHDGYGEVRAGAMLQGDVLPFPRGAAVVLEIGAGWWCRTSELELISRSLQGVTLVSVTGTDLRIGGARDGVVTGLAAIAAELARLIEAPPLFHVA